jgi:hypothetical protein
MMFTYLQYASYCLTHNVKINGAVLDCFVMYRYLLSLYHRWLMLVERPEIDFRLLQLFASVFLPSFSFWQVLSGAFHKRNWV